MTKKKAIKIATATAIAASAFTAVAPAQSEAATSLTSQISAAKAAIKKPYNTYYRGAEDTKPASLSTIKSQLAAAKTAKTNIINAIKKSKLTATQKKAKYAEIAAYDKYITYTQGYVNAVSMNVNDARTALDKAVASGVQSDIQAAVTALNTKISQLEAAVAKVYGKYTRQVLTNYYAAPAKKQAVEAQKVLDDAKAKAEADAAYAVTKAAVEAKVDAYVSLANGDLTTQALVDAAKAAKAEINLTGLKDADQATLQGKVDAADAKVAAAEKALGYTVDKAAVEAKVDAYVALANGDLTTQALVDAAKAAKAEINLTGLEDADQATLQTKVDAQMRK